MGTTHPMYNLINVLTPTSPFFLILVIILPKARSADFAKISLPSKIFPSEPTVNPKYLYFSTFERDCPPYVNAYQDCSTRFGRTCIILVLSLFTVSRNLVHQTFTIFSSCCIPALVGAIKTRSSA